MFEFTPIRWFSLSLLLGFAACMAPAPRCAIPETRELGKIDHLIAQNEATLARGYVMKRGERSGINFCLGSQQSHVGVSFCTDPVRSQPVAIDETLERRKLAALKVRREALKMLIAEKTAACAQPDQ